MSHKQDSYQISRLLEDSISSLFTAKSSDPLSYLAAHFNHERTPDTPSHVCFKLAQLPYTHPAFPDTCYEVYSQCKDVILNHASASRDAFLREIYSEILVDIPKELAKLLTSKLQTIPPSDFSSFSGNITTCYTYKIYINNSCTLYSHLCAGRETPIQEDLLEAVDTLIGELVLMKGLSDSDRRTLISLAQGLALRDAGTRVSKWDFTQTLATLFVETL